MLDSILLRQHKGIKENTEIISLGKINIICGKNNSGKTSILSAIENEENCFTGVAILLDHLSQIIFNNKLSNAPEQVILDQLKNLIEELQTNDLHKSVWFVENIDNILSPQLKKHCPAINDTTAIRNILVEEINLMEKAKRMFIPSKRKLDDTFELKYNHTLETDGRGVLNQLFEFKNQLDITEKKQRYLKIKKQFGYITDGYDFEIDLNSQKINLFFTNNTAQWINSHDSGMGLKDLLIILFFMNIPELQVILIDEVETHMHPDMQRKLLYVMNNESEKQFILSTHSNVFLDNTLVDRIYHSSFQQDKGIKIDNATSKSAILNDIGFSVADNLISDLVILTEGPSDKPVIEEFLNKMGLLIYNIKIWPLGGDIMDQLDLRVFKDSYKIMALIDNDPGSLSVRKRFKERCEENDIFVYQLERYSIENYFSIDALREVYKNQVPEGFILNPKEKLETQLFNVKRRNRNLAKHTALDSIKNSDLYEFLLLVQKLLEEGTVPSPQK